MADLNQAVQRASDDLHNTAVAAQQALASVTAAAQAITGAAQSAKGQVGNVGGLVDSAKMATQQVIVMVNNTNEKIKSINPKWPLK